MLRRVSYIHHLIAAAVAATLLSLASVPAEAGCSQSVVMYSTSWCPYCKQVRSILARNHIQYTILDADTAQVQATMRRLFGDTAVPRTVIGGVVVEGVDEARIKQLCRQQSDGGAAPIDVTPIGITLPDSPPPRHDAETRLAAPANPSQG